MEARCPQQSPSLLHFLVEFSKVLQSELKGISMPPNSLYDDD